MDRHTQARLKRENAIWLVTAGRDLQPQAVPVWYLWDGTSFLIYAQPGIKVRHVRENPNVELHLNTDEAGDIWIIDEFPIKVDESRHKGRNVKKLEKSSEKPLGEWNEEEITAQGRHITVKLNDTVIVDANLDDVKDPAVLKKHPGLANKSGHIGFLGHGARVEFRNLRIKEL